MFQKSPLLGLLFFDLLGMVAYLFFVPVMLSFYVLLRRENETMALVALVLFVIGVAAFFASNTGFAVLSSSEEYALAKTDAEKAILLASCRTMIALFDVNAFMVSYVIVSAAWAMTGLAMLQSPVFSRITGPRLHGSKRFFTGGDAGRETVVREYLDRFAVSPSMSERVCS